MMTALLFHTSARAWTLLLLLVSISFSSLRGLQQSGVELKALSESPLSAKPGTVVTLPVNVANTTGQRQQYDARAVLPTGWRVLVDEGSFELAPRQSDTRLVSFSIPTESPTQTSSVRYAVRDRSQPPNSAEVEMEIRVLPVRRLELHFVGAPRFVVSGERYRMAYTLINKSNVGGSVRLSARSLSDFAVNIDSTVVWMAPGEQRTLSVRVETDAGIGAKTEHTLELLAELVEDRSVQVRSSGVVEIIPREASVEQQYHELPLYLSYRTAGTAEAMKQQFQLFGAGSFSEDHRDRIEFQFRGPETQTHSILGARDEYRISYRRPEVELYLGDGNFLLSPLTELGRYASGASAKVSLGSFSLGGYYNETR
ncbi:MAG: hypothetical protein ACRDGA_01515, partial [Bacteroidota bacterium]